MASIVDTYHKYFLEVEFLISGVICLLSILLMNYVWSSQAINKWIFSNKDEIYPLVATIAGTLLGFVITGVSILIAFSESERLKLLKQASQFKTIFTIYFSTMKFLAMTTIVAVSGIVIDDRWAIPIFYLLLWSIIVSSLRIWRCFWILENIAKIIL